jgi:hypothetical protein
MSRLDDETRAYLELKEALKAEYGLEEDDNALRDTLEGATNLHEALDMLAFSQANDLALAEAVKGRIASLRDRMSSFENSADRKRTLIAKAMTDCGLKTPLRLPAATLSFSHRKAAPKVVDEDALPIFYTKAGPRVIDREAIKSEYERCIAEKVTFFISGVVVTNAEPVLTVRTK